MKRLVFTVIMLTFCSVLNAAQYFVKIDGVAGESTAPGYEGDIDVRSLVWKTSEKKVSPLSNAKKRANISEVSFIKKMDSSSTDLFKYVSTGKTIPKAEIVMRKAEEDPFEYLTIFMKNIIITSVEVFSSAAGLPLEEKVTLEFAEVKVKYQPQNDDGSLKPEINMEWKAKQK